MPEAMNIDQQPQKIDGRTKAGRALRAAKAAPQAEPAAARRAPARAQMRTQAQTPMRESQRGDEPVLGRDGQALTRRRVAGIDQYHIPQEIIPEGWDYQWNTVSVYNNQDLVVGQSMQMYENGWRPVPASRHPGRFVPIGSKGDIIRDGMRLEERPKSLGDQARAEDIAVARRQMSDRDNSLMGGKAGLRNALDGTGFEMGGKYRGTGGDLKVSVDRALDIPPPSHTLAEPGE